MAEAAPVHGVEMRFESVPDGWFAVSAAAARRPITSATATSDVVALDSIVAAHASPWIRHVDVPLVAVLHQPPGGIDRSRAVTALLARLDLRSYRRAALVVAASESIAEAVVSAGLDAGRVRVVPPGRDAGTPGDDRLLDLRRGRRASVLCVANWQRRKGVLDLLEAVKLLPPGTVSVHLAGDTRLEPKYGKRVRDALAHQSLREAVFVHGRVSRTEVDALYQAADIFVLPSYREPYGTVYGEAMARGLPVVGWAAGNLPNLATDGREGRVVPTGDVAELARAIRQLADDPARRAAMAEAARHRAERLPTWSDSAAAFFSVMREAAG